MTMLLALLALTLLTPREAPPTIGSIEGLEPSVIGELVLSGRDNGIIESVTPDRGIDPPGSVKLKLTERARALSGGCLRRQWTATFHHDPGATRGTAILSEAYVTNEVSLPTASGCQNGEFAHVNPGLSIEEALRALRHLRLMRSGGVKVRFSCLDSTGSTLCPTRDSTRRELARLPAWAVTKRNGNIEFWLGQRGQVVTAVRYSENARDDVRVDRSAPAPF
jgi:hypothetical protein